MRLVLSPSGNDVELQGVQESYSSWKKLLHSLIELGHIQHYFLADERQVNSTETLRMLSLLNNVLNTREEGLL